MAKSDIMISDFSGIIFEYAFTFKKPVITLNKEVTLEQYDAGDLSCKTWKFSVQNDLGCSITEDNFNELTDIIEDLTKNSNPNKIESIANTYWKNQGHCIANIVNYLEKEIKNIEG